MDGNNFVRIGKMQTDTIGVELDDDEFSGIFFICTVSGCTDPDSIFKETLGSIYCNISPSKIFPDPAKIKRDRWFRVVRVTKGFVGTNKEVVVGKGQVLIFERGGDVLVVPKDPSSTQKVHKFLLATDAIHS